MKISNDQNRIEFDDGEVLVSKSPLHHSGCYECAFYLEEIYVCHNVPCRPAERNDGLEKIFIKECE